MGKIVHHPARWACVAGFLACGMMAAAQDVQAAWQLESPEGITGQGLGLMIEVQGVDRLDPPDIRIPGVSVEWQGGSPMNSTSMVSVNGRTTTTVRKSFRGTWSLKAAKPGSYRVPATEWDLMGTRVRLPALAWRVMDAPESRDSFLVQELVPSIMVAGMPGEYRLTWYIGSSVQAPDFTLPLLDIPGLEVTDLQAGKGQDETVSFRVGRHVLVARKSSGALQGKQYTTLSFRMKIRSPVPLEKDLGSTMVAFKGMTGTRKVQDFFGDEREEPVYGDMVLHARALSLKVTALPAAGRPAVFSGLVGDLHLAWSGGEGTHQVGEPVRLRLDLSGVANLPDVDLDHMVLGALGGRDDFTLASDPADPGASADSGAPTVSRGYVLRARHPGDIVVPSLELNYFDPVAMAYRTVRTQALHVLVEGRVPGSPASPAGNGMAGDSALSASGGINGGPEGKDGSAPVSPDGGFLVNPPGEARPGMLLHPLPFLLIPGIPGLLLGLAGWWFHSRLRRTLRARREWRLLLGPLGGSGDRALLAEGRERLARLEVLAGDAGWTHDEAEYRKAWIRAARREWDEGWFGPARQDSDWLSRWQEMAAGGDVTP